MDYEKAKNIVIRLLPIIQKFKSDAKESIEKFDAPEKTEQYILDMVFEGLYPWLSGDKDITLALIKMNERLETGGGITPQEFYNVMFVFHRFLPTVKYAIGAAFDLELPDPDIQWLKGWENYKASPTLLK